MRSIGWGEAGNDIERLLWRGKKLQFIGQEELVRPTGEANSDEPSPRGPPRLKGEVERIWQAHEFILTGLTSVAAESK